MRRAHPTRRLAVPLLLLVALVMAGCAGPQPMQRVGPAAGDPQAAVQGDPAAPGDHDPALERFYEQDVSWQACGDFECAELSVPLSYDDPAGESIRLALKRLPSGGEPIGSLVVNPGGPGSSGVDLVDSVGSMFSPELRRAYDVVGFDPRGVGESAPVECVSDAQLDRLRAADHDLDTAEGMADFRADTELIAQGCLDGTGALLGHVDTESAARDMDILRATLGEDRLDYLGYSYGTYLGAVYADTFPDRVGRFVLDGAMDPSQTGHEMVRDQAAGFGEALRAYVADCQAGPGCPLTGGVENGMEQVRTLLDLASTTPLPTADGRPLTGPLAVSGLLTPLYDTRSWPVLTSALTQAMHERDGSQLLYLADLMAGRGEDGTYRDNSTEANWAVNCLDHPADGDLQDWRQQADELARVAPTFGPALSYGDMLCDAWPVEGQEPRGAVHAAGSQPIVVIGTTGDPATPYAWSVSLADQLDGGVLVTYDGEGHTAYGRSNACITEAVDAYLIDGVVPTDGLTC